ncbi:MAG TPA: hypothetical protein VFR50_14760 [Casimicrobiaceae bacterium]|jgi:hypothetical protein|nr:hypothetical protein [Casimicrobiaceae bacterium]
MTNRARRRRAALRDWRNFLTGALIGIAVQTPVFAATHVEFNPSEWTQRLQHGDPLALGIAGAIVFVIAAVAVALGTLARRHASKATAPDPENSIGRYRPFRQ